MNKIAYLKYLIGKRIPRVVSPNVVRYTEGLVKQSLCEVYIKALRAHTGKSEIHAAVIGFDPLMYYNLEVLSDFGVAIDGFYEGPEKDFQHPSKLLRELDLRGFDLLILCALTESEEDSLAEKLGKILSVSDGKCHVLRISRLYFALYSVLSTFRSSLRSGLNPKKLALLAISLSVTKGGNVIECGTAFGGGTVFMARVLKALGDNRKIHTFDTFEGMPEPTEKDEDTAYQKGVILAPYDSVKRYVRAANLDQDITLHKGLIQETLPLLWQTGQSVSFALSDTDQYTGTIVSLLEILPRLEKNGIILIDDYELTGVRKAIEEVKEKYPKLGGELITSNFYMLWNETDRNFLSHL